MVATAPVPRVRFVSVRRAGSERRLAVLDAETRARYERLVARAAGVIEASLSDAVVANRLRRWRAEPPELRLRPWRAERRIFAARLVTLARGADEIAFADVRRCFASISPGLVGQTLRRLAVDGAEDVEDLLRDLEPEGVPGLPVGPDPSAILANAVLAPVDDALERAGIPHLRWVDDVVMAGHDPDAGLDVVRSALDRMGLRLNERKTRVVADPCRVLGRRMSPSR